MNADVQAFADQHGIDASTVEFMAQHIMREMGDAMLEAKSEAELVELMRAGLESSQRAVERMAHGAMTNHKLAGAVYQELRSR